MAGQVANVAYTSTTYIEEVADALDDKVGFFVGLGTTADENSIALAADNDDTIGVMMGKLQDGQGIKAPCEVALIDGGGIVRVKAGGTIAKGAGVQWGTGGKGVTAVLGTNDTLGVAQEAAVLDDLFPVLLSRATPA